MRSNGVRRSELIVSREDRSLPRILNVNIFRDKSNKDMPADFLFFVRQRYRLRIRGVYNTDDEKLLREDDGQEFTLADDL